MGRKHHKHDIICLRGGVYDFSIETFAMTTSFVESFAQSCLYSDNKLVDTLIQRENIASRREVPELLGAK